MFHAQTYDGCLPFTKITRVKILNAGKHSISKSAEHIKVKSIVYNTLTYPWENSLVTLIDKIIMIEIYTK